MPIPLTSSMSQSNAIELIRTENHPNGREIVYFHLLTIRRTRGLIFSSSLNRQMLKKLFLAVLI
jgi:hypothetical protein